MITCMSLSKKSQGLGMIALRRCQREMRHTCLIPGCLAITTFPSLLLLILSFLVPVSQSLPAQNCCLCAQIYCTNVPVVFVYDHDVNAYKLLQVNYVRARMPLYLTLQETVLHLPHQRIPHCSLPHIVPPAAFATSLRCGLYGTFAMA